MLRGVSRPLFAAATGASPFDAWWTKQRTRTITELNANHNDKSNKGSVDVRISPLLDYVNSHPDFFSLSSCSGRVSLYHRLSNQQVAAEYELGQETGSESQPQESESTGPGKVVKKKRGHGHGDIWSSHDPVQNIPQVSLDLAKLIQSLAQRKQPRQTADGDDDPQLLESSSSSYPLVPITSGVLEIKFEPMLLHFRCKTMEGADMLMTAAARSGHRRSGIWRSPFKVQAGSKKKGDDSSWNTSQQQQQHRITTSLNSSMGYSTPLVVNGSELVPGILLPGQEIGDQQKEESTLALRQTLQRHLEYANILLEENYARTARLEGEIRQELGNFEPSDLSSRLVGIDA